MKTPSFTQIFHLVGQANRLYENLIYSSHFSEKYFRVRFRALLRYQRRTDLLRAYLKNADFALPVTSAQSLITRDCVTGTFFSNREGV